MIPGAQIVNINEIRGKYHNSSFEHEANSLTYPTPPCSPPQFSYLAPPQIFTFPFATTMLGFPCSSKQKLTFCCGSLLITLNCMVCFLCWGSLWLKINSCWKKRLEVIFLFYLFSGVELSDKRDRLLAAYVISLLLIID